MKKLVLFFSVFCVVSTIVPAPSPRVMPFLAASKGRQGSSDMAWKDLKPLSTKRENLSAPVTTACLYWPDLNSLAACCNAMTPDTQACEITTGVVVMPRCAAMHFAELCKSKRSSGTVSSNSILPLVVASINTVSVEP